MKKCTGKVCSECPYRKDSIAGYFGPYEIEEYSEPLSWDIEVPCHMTAGKMDERERPLCSGLAAVRVNSFKMARDESSALRESELVMKGKKEERDKCFGFRNEFEKHHKK